MPLRLRGGSRRRTGAELAQKAESADGAIGAIGISIGGTLIILQDFIFCTLQYHLTSYHPALIVVYINLCRAVQSLCRLVEASSRLLPTSPSLAQLALAATAATSLVCALPSRP